MRMCHFWAQNNPLVLEKLFLIQTIIIQSMHPPSRLGVGGIKILLAVGQKFLVWNGELYCWGEG